MEDFFDTAQYVKMQSRKVLFEDKDLLKFYRQDNRIFLKEGSKQDFVNNVENGLFADFIFFEENEFETIFFHIKSNLFLRN